MYILHIGVSGYPSNSAPMHRIGLTLRGLKLAGFSPLVINKYSIYAKNFKRIEKKNGLPIVFTSLITERPAGFFIRTLNKLSGIAGEAYLLIKKRKKIHTAILYTPSFGELVYYRMISKLLGFKLIFQYVELRSSITGRNTRLNQINDRLFDNNFHHFCDGVIAISDFLIKHIETKSNNLPVLKIPAMCDFSEFKMIEPFKGKSYLLYCGFIVYFEVIEFIIDTFSSIRLEKGYSGNLVLVISGNDDNIRKQINDRINRANLGEYVEIKNNIPYSELLSLYKGADILIIPLRNTIQDIARFPHKIGEYTASGRPILSTNLGELKVYFKDGISAILADEYSVSSYVKKLTKILPEQASLDLIGKNGLEIGIKNLDYQAQGLMLNQFILNL